MWFRVSQSLRVPVCIVAILLAFVFMLVFRSLDLETPNSAASKGIVSLELAGTVQRADAIIAVWTSKFGDLQRAWLSILIDFGFILVYSTALGLSCILASEMFRAKHVGPGLGLPRIGILLAWGASIAGLLDVMENLAMVAMLWGARAEIWPQLAHSFATVKFALVLAGLGYSLVGVGWSLGDWWACISSWVRGRTGSSA
ncbi:MAG TPA: hypothetical protein VF914_23050 [Chloroflexia bacterium]|jgi:hypothetical protein